MPSTAVNSSVAKGDRWIHVVAGIIFNLSGDAILLARRPLNKHQGGKWEFPGGKVEPGEAAADALSRELDEELGIQAIQDAISPFLEIKHCYSDKNIFLDVWKVVGFSGKPHGREGQEVRWFALEALRDLDFPEANTPIVEQLLGI